MVPLFQDAENLNQSRNYNMSTPPLSVSQSTYQISKVTINRITPLKNPNKSARSLKNV